MPPNPKGWGLHRTKPTSKADPTQAVAGDWRATQVQFYHSLTDLFSQAFPLRTSVSPFIK